MAWALEYENVSTVILGVSKVEQLDENMKSLEVLKHPEFKNVCKKIDDIFGTVPEPGTDWKTFKPLPRTRKFE